MLFRPIRFFATLTALLPLSNVPTLFAGDGARWAGTWAAAAQPFMPGTLETYDQQTLRLIVHTSVAGSRVRVTLSNVYGEVPLSLANAHVAIRTVGPTIDPSSDRVLRFQGQTTVTLAPHAEVTSDAVSLEVPALSDLAVSFFVPHKVDATTSHLLALQTSYVASGNFSSAVELPVLKTIDTWPFLVGIEISAQTQPSAIAVVGSSTTDGDGSTQDQNRRWPDVLAKRLQQAGGAAAHIGVLNLGIIGNRLLQDSPQTINPKLYGSKVSTYWRPHSDQGAAASGESPFGLGLGESVLKRFDRDVLSRPGIKYLILCIGVNDIVFPGSFTPPDEAVTARSVIQGHRQLIARAHKAGIRVFVTTIAPFENAIYQSDKTLVIYTPAKEAIRQEVNHWIRTSKEFDGMIDFDVVLRDPARPTRLLERFDSGDHVHSTDAGYAAAADAVPLTLFTAPQR